MNATIHKAKRPLSVLQLVVLALVLVLLPVIAKSEDAAFFACISGKQWNEAKTLGPAPALNLAVAPENVQTLQSCINYCRSGAIPPGIGQPRGFANFRPPYKYATFGNGRWCFCGNEVKGATLERGACLGKMNCLLPDKLNRRCYVNTEPDHMVIDIDPPARAAPGVTGLPPVTQPSAAGANRRPHPPTVPAGGYDPPFPIQYEGAYQMSWRNNGDPDGDVLTFGVFIWQYDWSGRRWVQVPTIRDQYGTYGRTWLKQDNFTFTTAQGLSPKTHYAWMVFACDLDKGPATLCSWSGWSLFRTQ